MTAFTKEKALKMKILFICNHIPYSETNGVEVKISNLLRCMKNITDVTCVFIIDDTKLNINALKMLKNNDLSVVCKSGKFPAIRYLKHLNGNIVVKNCIKIQLNEIITKIVPDVIWLEFGYICRLIPCLKKYGIPIYYGSHNSQSKLDYEIWRANNNQVDKVKMAPFIMLYWLQERLFMGLADRFFCISKHDIEYYSNFVARNKLSLLPFFFDCRHLLGIAPITGEYSYICLVGSLRSYQNYSAAVYTLEKVWPYIQSNLENLQLYVIGELPEEHSKEYRILMQKKENFDTVKFTGKVETVIPYVKGALVNIVPLTLGSGVRTKIIESAACRTPVVSTTIGVKGLPFENGKSILIADEPREFADHVINLVKNGDRRREIAEHAFEAYRRELSFEAGTVALMKIFVESTEEKTANKDLSKYIGS